MQKYLHLITKSDPDMITVYPDGIYDENTAKAVEDFQKKNGLDPTGTVNADTFCALRDAYDRLIEENRPREKADVFGCSLAGNSISLGEEFDSVYILQVMLCVLADFYGFEPVDINGCFDDKTENAVLCFQKIHGLPQTGSADRKTLNEITTAYNGYIRKEL